MELRRVLAIGIGVGAIGASSIVPAFSHGTPTACVLRNSPAEVNNVEMGVPSITSDVMSKAVAGHAGQKVGVGSRFGLYYPVTDPKNADGTMSHMMSGPPGGRGLNLIGTVGDNFNWRQTGVCNKDTILASSYTASGTGLGYCGRSIGFGTGSIAGHSTIIRWESVATQLILTDPSAVGSVNAQAAPPGTPTGSCVDGGATVFAVDGVVAHT